MELKCFQRLCLVTVASLVLVKGCISTATPKTPSLLPLSVTLTPTPLTYIPWFAPTKPPESTPPLSPTMAPRLTADQEKLVVLDLLQSNAGCQLPCWWGFTPGKTAWQTAHTFFASLGKVAIDQGRPFPSYKVEFTIAEYGMHLFQEYIIIGGTIKMIWIGAGMTRNNEAVFGDPLFAQALQRFMLSQLLATYGQPEEVLIRTFGSAPNGGWVPFHLLLFYPHRGILVDYQGPNERKGENLRWCPQKTNVSLWLWSPEDKWTLEDIARLGPNLSLDELKAYHPLEEATDMSLEAFYKTFKGANNRLCLETPADMWP